MRRARPTPVRRHPAVRRLAALLTLVMLAEAAVLVEGIGTAVAVAGKTPQKQTAATAQGAAEAVDLSSARLRARLQDRAIEALSERTETSSTWALPDGRLRTTSYAGPVRVRRDGGWRAIDTSLVDSGPHLAPRAAAADVTLSDGGDTKLAAVSKGRARFGMGWATSLPAPKVKKDTAVYDLGDGQRLEVTALKQGFSQNVVLGRAPDGPVSYRIPLTLDGLRLSAAASGHLLLKDTAGRLVAEAPAPVMWDATKHPLSGDPEHVARVDTRIETAADGTQTLVLSPDADFLADPATRYPVTVDPATTLAATTDTWVQTPDYPDSQVSSTELKSGTYNTGADKARSYLKFDVSAYAGKKITDTNLALYSYYSSTCATTGAGTEVRRITGTWDSSAITWGTQPATTSDGAVVNKAALGYNSGCPGGTMNFDIDAIVQAWANGSPNYGVRVAGASETDPYTWRRFRSANYVSGDNSAEPHLTVTYDSLPVVPTGTAISPSQRNAYNGRLYVTSLTPTLSAKVTSPAGGNVQAQFEITPDPAYADTTYSLTANGNYVASGSVSSLTVPAANTLPSGAHLRLRVRGYDGSGFGAYTDYTTFTLNTVKPTAPTVSCAAYPADVWTAKASGAVNCTLDTSATDGQGYLWGLDDEAVAQRVDDTSDGTGGDPLTISIDPAEGWHTLYAKTVDSGGNVSTTATAYSFGAGSGAAMLSPGDGDRPARRLALAATGRSGYTGVTYYYRRGEADTWKTVPLADVTRASDGSAVTAWPLAAPGGNPPALTWNVTTSLAEDGAIDIRGAFTDGSTTGYTPDVTVTVDREAGDAPSREIGPGEVNLLTGDFTITENDATAFGMAVTRSISSRRATADEATEGQAQIFGPYWTSGVASESTGSDWTSIRQTSPTSVEVLDSEGMGTGFTATSGGGWAPEPGAEVLSLTGSLTGTFTLKDTSSGATATFAKVDAAATTWQAATSYLVTSGSTVTTVSEKVTAGGSTLARPKLVIAPTSAVSADTCASTPQTKGCRVVELLYATTTTATGWSSAADFGDYTGQVREIRLWSTEPGAATATARPLAAYRYDASGRLRQEWNPNLSQATQTQYSYDSAGRVFWLHPRSELAWDFTYGKAGNAATAGEGMLLQASRPGLKQGTADVTEGTAATSLVYDVPLSGSNAPYAMGPTSVAAWGQEDVPSDATAVFPPDAVPASHDGRTLTAGAYQRAGISYIDPSGREVNNASPGGYVSTVEYDWAGNVRRELTPGNRELALSTGGAGLAELTRLSLSGASTADRARALSTIHAYSADGQRETESFGPLHLATLAGAHQDLAAGTEVAVREHTVTRYDEGRPTDGSAKTAGLATSVTTGARIEGYPTDADTVTDRTGYDWTKGLATSTVQDAGGKNLTRTTAYNADGRVIKATLPESSGTDAGATVSTYWSATGTGTCQGRPEWAGLLCSTGPAAAITGGGANPGQLPVKTIEYDWWGQVGKVTETSGTTTRTTTFSTDNAGRTNGIAITGGTGTAVPATTITYDSETGRLATRQSNGLTISYGYDRLGRQTSYDDGRGNVTSTTYDLLDRPVKMTDSAPSTTTFAYDPAKDPRGLPTSKTDSVAGTFSATYDADGQLATERLPGGYTLTITGNQAGDETAAVYTRDSDGTVVTADTADYTVHGRVTARSSTAGDTTRYAYTYDNAGRLTRADNTAADSSCTRRTYTFDDNTNRTALATSVSDPGAACTDTGAVTDGSAYDSADRLIAAEVAYDAFGRTVSQPGGVTIDYFTNDLVRRQTSGSGRQTWDLEPGGRLGSSVTETQNADGTWTQTARKTNHYASDDDSPTWTADDSSGARARNVRGPSGNLAAVTSATGDTVLQLTNIHGDVTVQLPLDTAKSATVLRQDEYGNPVDGSTSARYGWLGGQQRSAETVTGAILMGSRLYDPALGRFLSQDPVAGGNANAYEYSTGDPVNKEDTSGQWHRWRTRYYSWGKVVGHAWRFWKSCWCSGWGWHIGVSARIYFTWRATKRIANEGPYVLTIYGFIAAIIAVVNIYAGVLAAIAGAYAAWIVYWAYLAKERGRCLRVFVTFKFINVIQYAYAYPWYSRC
ncbi:DNRLRE domain-containing protein [Streptomyces sp. NPDC051940]|uniref:DNRLRE domain-containing protein n=1 Tax=Streptomyces sp. NPDC051940 TaxID=3155675 RepID=UPI003436CAB2